MSGRTVRDCKETSVSLNMKNGLVSVPRERPDSLTLK